MITPIILNLTTIEETIDFKERLLYGKEISKMTKEDMYNVYMEMYNDNYFINLDNKSKIQIRNCLVKRLDMTILEKQIDAETGINNEWIKNLIVEVLEEVQKVVEIPEKNYDYTIRFWESIGMMGVRNSWERNCIKKDNRFQFDYEMKNLFDKNRLIKLETDIVIERKRLKNTNVFGELIK